MTDLVVMDCGAHIGLFARYALDRGATKVVCYEPEADNWSLLVQNVNDPRAELHNAALVEDDREAVQFYVNNGKNTGTHTTLPTKGRQEVVVRAMNFQKELDRVQPHILKIDVEGAEHYLLREAVIPVSVRKMTVEFDARKKVYDVPMRDHAQWLIENRLKPQGFEMVNSPRWDTTTWSVIVKMQRS